MSRKTSKTAVLEPRIDPATKQMDVGGLLIPPTNTITALLYGFANHEKPRAREFYFWRVCEELWCHEDLPEPLMVRHPWAEEMIWGAINSKYLAVGGSASSGKCLAPDELVRMADGSTKRAADVVVGDLLAGDDGTSRRVLDTVTGRSNMVEIRPRWGQPWRCNDDHVLTLRRTWTHKKSRRHVGEVIDISVKDYLNRSATFKRQHRLFKACAHFPAQDIPVDPRLYGIWLADGDKVGPVIASSEAEVEVTEYLLNVWPSVSKYRYDSYGAPKYRICNHPAFNQLIKDSTATGYKRIDRRYIENSEDVRLQLLAGLLDGDGHANGNGGFEISQVHRPLVEDIKELADSLGFSTSQIREHATKCPKKDGGHVFGVTYMLRISGDTTRIPTLRKKPKTQVRRPHGEEPFEIVQLGEGDYAGFSVDGNHRFLLADGTVTHNSHTMAAWGIVNWLSAPKDTLVLMTSTTLREARQRIWGSIISLLTVIPFAPCKIRDSIGSVAYLNENNDLIERAGLRLIAAERSKTREAIGKFIGIKQKRVILIGDELSEISESILHAGLSNLSKNPSFQMIGMSNPNSRFDAFGIWAEPKDGWDSVDTQTADGWRTKWGGSYIRLDGERSPNILLGTNKYPWLPTQEKLDEDRALLGPQSRGYLRMVRAVFFDSDETQGIYSEAEIVKAGATNQVTWATKPIKVAGLDPAFTNGGDRTVLYIAEVGYLQNGQYAICFKESHSLNDDASNKAIPRSYQIVQQVRDICTRAGVSPEYLAVDSTGAGGPFCDILAGEWSSRFMRVTFGGKASDKRISMTSKVTGEEMYVNRVSELWFAGKELLRTRQIYGIDADLAKEITSRNYDMVKTSSLKVKIESKAEFKSRFGRSPDLADAAFLALDAARQQVGLVAIEPPKADDSGIIRPPVSIRQLSSALANADASLD